MNKMIQLEQEDRTQFLEIGRRVKSTGIQSIRLSERTKIPELKRYMHPLHRIMSVISGEHPYRICRDNQVQSIRLTPGNILFCSRYALTIPPLKEEMGPMEMFTLVFFPQYIRFLFSVAEMHGKEIVSKHYWYHTSAPMPQPGWDILQALNELVRQDDKIDLSRQLLIFMYDYCLDQLLHDQPPPGSKSLLTYHRIKDYMVENMHLPINRDQVARTLQLNPSHISKLFCRYDEHNFNASLKIMRMELAMELVRENHFSIDEITEQCGFINTGYFIKSFREFYGKTPGAFRIKG